MALTKFTTPHQGKPPVRDAPTSKWLVTIAVMFGTFLSVMDVTVVNVAMPHMMGAFGVNLLTITWISTGYSIAEIIMVTMSSWWATVLGRKRLFIGSMVLFIVGSILAGTSQSFDQIFLYRIIQGIGGGSLIPVSQAILRETFPPAEQGMAMAIYSMGVVLAPAIGPVLGGWLIDTYSWRWVFYINVPFCIAGVAMVSTFVHDPSYLKRGVRRVDWGGIALLTIGLATTQLVLERGEQVNWFSSNSIVFGTAVSAISLVGLVVWELRQKEPVVNLRLLRNRPLTVGSTMGMLIGFALFGTSFLVPQLTEELLDYPAFQAGLVLLPRALMMIAVMPLVGQLYNRISPRFTVTFGLVLLIWAYWQLSHFALTITFWSFVPVFLLSGAGMGGAMVTLSTVALSSIQRENMTGASSLYTLLRREAGNISYALMATILSRRTQTHHAYLAANIQPMNPAFRQYRSDLSQQGLSFQPWAHQGLSVISTTVYRQARMMAYDDTFFLLVILLGAVLPLVLLLPRQGYREPTAPSGH